MQDDPFILRWKAGIGDYARVIGFAGLAFLLTPFIIMFTPLSGLVKNVWVILGLVAASVAAIMYLSQIRRQENERQFIFSRDGISYHKFRGEVHDMSWSQISSVYYEREFNAHTHELSTGAKLHFKSSSDQFTFRGLSDVQSNELLIVLLRLKLGDKFKSDGGSTGVRTRKPQSARTAANVLRAWGDFDLAERILRPAIAYAPVFDKGNLDAYLDDYANILKNIGRTEEAKEIEARAPERVKELCTRKSMFDTPK